MNSSGKVPEKNLNDFIDSFISSQVTGRGLDERTEKAYRLDLEHFYRWLKTDGQSHIDELSLNYIEGNQKKIEKDFSEDTAVWKKKVEQYLSWLSQEKRLRNSTISRKSRVFGYFLAYLAKEGILSGNPALCYKNPKLNADILNGEGSGEKEHTVCINITEPAGLRRTGSGIASALSRKEIDAFFQAIRRETEEVDSDFRRRVCLRDHVMMRLLFCHGIEISELLKIEISDYDRKNGILTIRKKKGKGYRVRLFSKELQEQMEAWLAEHEYFEHQQEFQGRLFLSKLGRPLSMKMVILIFEKYRILAGIDKECTPKDLKNSLERYGIELAVERCE